MNEPIETLEQAPQVASELLVQYGPRFLTAGLILVAGLLVTRWLGGLVDRGLSRFSLEPPVRLLLVRVVRLIVLALFVIMALQNLGIDLLPLIAGLGIAGAGVALALQGVLGNVAAGLTIIFTRPFRVGQYISVVGEEGMVETITLFSTSLRHPDLSTVVIPNRKIVGEILHNYGEIRQLDLAVAIPYEADVDAAIAAVRKVLTDNTRVLQDPEPVIRAERLGDYAITIAVKPWVAVPDYGASGGEINPAIVRAFHEHGIPIAKPVLAVSTRSAHSQPDAAVV